MTHFVIVGFGAAGLSAAEVIRRYQPLATITVVTDDVHGFYSRPGLAYVLTHEVPEKQLFPISQDRWRELNLRRVNGRAVRLDTAARQIVMEDGLRLTYDALLLATGARAITPDLPGIDLPGVAVLDSMEDSRHLRRLARRASEAVVIGGGITALEMVEGLQARKVRVHYLMRGDRFWRNVLDEAESRLVEERLTAEGVALHHHAEAESILGKRDWRGRHKVSGVRTTDGQVIPCEVVGMAIGVRPRLELVAATDIETDRGIVVDERLQTSVPGIFAAGDVAQVHDPITGRKQLDVLWPVAVAQGRVAGANMAGVPTTYWPGVPLNVTRLAGLLVTIIGAVGSRGERDPDLLTISRGDSEVWRGIPNAIVIHDQHDVNRQRLVIKDNRIVGAILFGDQSLLSVVHTLIRNRVDIGSALPSLQAPQAHLAAILGRFAVDDDQARSARQA